MPTVAEGLPVRWLDPAAPWAAQIGVVPTSATHAAALVATVDLLFDDTKADLRYAEQVECVLLPVSEPLDLASLVTVDHDPRDLRSEPPEGAAYRIPDAPIREKRFAAEASRAIADHLLATRTISLSSNRDLELVSRPGETQTTDFTLPSGLPRGSYTLYVSACGVSSAGYPFTY